MILEDGPWYHELNDIAIFTAFVPDVRVQVFELVIVLSRLECCDVIQPQDARRQEDLVELPGFVLFQRPCDLLLF